MLADEAFAHRALEYLGSGFFTLEALGWIFTRYADYWKNYLTRMTETVLRQELRKCNEAKQQVYGPEVEAVLTVPPMEGAYIKATLLEFVRVNVFAAAHRESAELFTRKDYVNSFDTMRVAMDRIHQIEFEKPQRSYFFEELSERQENRFRRGNDLSKTPWMTAIPEIDHLTRGGVKESEVWAMLAYEKRGKSTFLANQGFHATRHLRQPTLHIMLEGTKEKVEDQYDTLFAYEQYYAVSRGNITASVYADMVSEYRMLRGKLVIRTLNEFDTSIDAIIAELTTLQATGFIPTRLIVDYVDLLRSRNKHVRDEQVHQLDSCHDLKRLCTQRGLACWTAWQAQRPDKGAHFTEHVLTAASIADCYAKARIVDAYGSINMTNQERSQGVARIYFEAYRDKVLNNLYRVQSDLQTLRMFTDVTPMEMKAA